MRSATFTCRGCGTRRPAPLVIDLGALPLGNSLITDEGLVKPEQKYPLALGLCSECTLVQVPQPLDTDTLLEQNLYFTSASPALVEHSVQQARGAMARLPLGPDSLVVEVGSNDGVLLHEFVKAQVPVLGIDPVQASADQARESFDIDTVVELFTADLARRMVSGGDRADLLIANYVLELVPDLADFATATCTLLAPTGVALFEVPYVRAMVEKRRFDGIAHLRVNWFSLTALDNLFRRHGGYVVDAEYIDAFRGGTLRFYVAPAPEGGAPGDPPPSVAAMLAEEQRLGLNHPAFFRPLQEHIDVVRSQLRAMISDLHAQGKTIAAYGAGIKAATLLNVTQIPPEMIRYVADANPAKHGLYLPGSHLPIVPPDRLRQDQPDCVLLCALDPMDEVLAQQSEYRRAGGKFIIPVPEPHLV